MPEVAIQTLGEGIAELSLSRAPVNALTPGYMAEITKALTELDRDDAVRAILLSSTLKVFSAGLDLKAAKDYDSDQQRAVVAGLDTVFPCLFGLGKPTVVAAHGAAIAGGLFFILACDWRVGGPKAQFGLAEVRVGADFPVGPLEIARDQLTAADLRRLMLRGQPFDAVQALAAGILDELSDTPHETAVLRAAELAKIPPQTYVRVKAQTRAPALARIKTDLAAQPERDWFNDETRAAMAAMLEG